LAEQQSGGTITFLFSDIEGSTRLLRQLRDRYAQVLTDHRTLMRKAFAEFGGEEMGSEGDAFFVAFHRASDAIGAAASAQRALAAHDWPEGQPLLVRMGLNTGEPAVEEEGYFGLGLHLTARICSAAHGGQVLVAQSTSAVCGDVDLPGVEFRDMGEHLLKDFDRPERLYQLVIDGLSNEFPPPRTLDKQTVDDAAFRPEVGTPYKGLESFQPQDAEFFFGREELIADLAGRLAGSAFLAVVGPSGSGKSSVVRAGLVPAIWTGAHGLAQQRDWKVVILTPGAHPLEELAVRLATERGLSPGSVLEDFRRDPHNMCLTVRQLLLDASPDAKVVLIIDQAEEIFTLCHDEEERRLFVELLAHAAEENAQTMVILALRADFYGHCATYPSLAALVQDHQSLVGPMREGEIRRAIELPASKAGLTLEDGLVTRILDDVGSEPGSLPLLSHALLETWSKRQDHTMTTSAYLESGGVRGAIARTADAIYGQLEPKQQELARRIFLRLAEPGQGTEDTRRRASLTELLPGGDEQTAVEEVLDILARARLITVGLDLVEVSHEALIREWPLLRRWLDEDREGLQLHRRLTDDAGEWVRYDRDPGMLYRGARLSTAEEWAEGREQFLSADERDFLESARAARQSELERARQRQQRLVIVAATLAVLLALAVVAAVFALSQRGRAQREERSAAARALVQAADAQLGQRIDLALLLGVEAERTKSTPLGRSILLAASQRAGRVLRILRGSAGAVSDVAFSADGKQLASIGADGRIRLWNVATRSAVGQPLAGPTPTQPGDAVAFGPGRLLASGDTAGRIRLWDVAKRRRLADLKAPSSVSDLAFSPDGKLLAAGTGTGAMLWEVASRHELRPRLTRGGLAVTRVAFSPDGRTLAAAGVDAVSLWNVRTRQETRLSSRSSVEAIAFHPNGRTLAAALKDGPLQLWSLRAPQSPPRRLSAIGAASAVAFSPDGGRLAVAHPTGEISLLDTREFRPLPVPLVGQTAAVGNVAFAPDGRTLATASDDGTAFLWDARPELRADALAAPGGSPVTAVDSADDGTIAAARGSDILVWTKNGRDPAPDTIRGTGLLLDVALSRNGKRIAAGSQDGEVLVAALPDGQVRRLPPRDPTVPEPVLDVALNADGTKLAASLHNGDVLLEQSNASRLGARLPGINDLSPFALALALSGDKLAAGRSDGTIAVWDAASGRPIGGPFGSTEDQILSIDLSPDAKVLASVSGDDVVRLWDVDSRRAFGEPLQARASLSAVRFSSNGSLAAVGTAKGAVALFDVANRQLLGEPFVGHSGNVYSVAFTSDGTGVVSGGADGRVLLWNVDLWVDESALRERACDLVGRNLTPSEWELYLPGSSYRRTCEQWPAGK
jgi:WD40 repeat protein/class 3 adenylate cyclase